VVWGGEVRVWRETYDSQSLLAFQNPTTDIVLGSIFAQDEFALTPRLKLTAGLKLEESSYSGFEWLPTVRAAWRYNDNGLLWSAISRSVRTPDRIERELEAPGVLEPSPDFESEKLTAFELGWRGQVKRASLSLSTYYNIYDDLRTQDYVNTPDGPLILTENGLGGVTAGAEAWGKLEVIKNWRISIGADALYKEFKVKPGHIDVSNLEAAGQDPSYQAQVRSEANLTSWLEFDADVRAVGRYDYGGAPAYVEGDARAAIRLARGVELSIDGRNLFNPRHLEAIQTFESLPSRYIPRTVFARLRWGF
jgi:iron complex outermembrane receptor protein